jgi:hypothetical protein
VLKKNIAAMMLSFTACANANNFNVNQHIEFSYTVDCETNYCFDDKTYSYQPPLFQDEPSFFLALKEPELKIEEPGLPKYLTIQDDKDWDYLMGQTYTILGLSVATVGLMTLLPESITKWSEEDRDMSQLGSKWKQNIKWWYRQYYIF